MLEMPVRATCNTRQKVCLRLQKKILKSSAAMAFTPSRNSFLQITRSQLFHKFGRLRAIFLHKSLKSYYEYSWSIIIKPCAWNLSTRWKVCTITRAFSKKCSWHRSDRFFPTKFSIKKPLSGLSHKFTHVCFIVLPFPKISSHKQTLRMLFYR